MTCNGIPAYHFAPDRRDLAERHATDADYRQAQVKAKLWERGQSRET